MDLLHLMQPIPQLTVDITSLKSRMYIMPALVCHRVFFFLFWVWSAVGVLVIPSQYNLDRGLTVSK